MLVHGTDRNGKWFEERTFALDLSSGVAAFISENVLDMGVASFVSIAAPPSEEAEIEFNFTPAAGCSLQRLRGGPSHAGVSN
jgi:hypothetical protein